MPTIMMGLPSVGFPTINSVMGSLWEDGSYTGELMLCVGLVSQARDEHMSQTNIEPVCYHHIGAPRHMVVHRKYIKEGPK